MPTKKPNAEQVWKQFEDHLAPRLGLCTIDRVVYSHLPLLARSWYGSFQAVRPRGCAPPRWAPRLAPGATQQGGSRGRGTHPQRGSRGSPTRDCPPPRKPYARTRLRQSRLPEIPGAAPGHSRPRRRALLLLPEPRYSRNPVPGSRRPACKVRGQFLAQPGFLLSGVQLHEKRSPRGRFSQVAASRAPPDRRRACRPLPRPGRPRRRQTPPSPPSRVGAAFSSPPILPP